MISAAWRHGARLVQAAPVTFAAYLVLYVPLWLAAGAVSFAVFVSVVAGWWPARRAARMDPVAALRYE